MNNPVQDIEGVIRALVQSPPSVQRRAVETYFTPDAAFQHPFCRTGSYEGSRFMIRAIYRWYKIMSPRIDLSVNSVAYDESNLILYVHMSQVFRIWLFPFYAARPNFTTYMRLKQNKMDQRYYITYQEDLYQINEWVKFIWIGGPVFVWLWQMSSTIFCLLGAMLFLPISLLEEREDAQKQDIVDRTSAQKSLVADPRHTGGMVTAPAVGQR